MVITNLLMVMLSTKTKKYFKKLFHLLLLVIALGCVPLSSGTSTVAAPEYDKKLLLDNVNYEASIKTVQLYPLLGYPQDEIQPAVVSLKQQIPLILEFDDLFEEVDNYYVKLIHCNADWTKSQYNDLDFLNAYNEFNILNYELSFDTKISYIHYRFQVPPVKLPGNYVIVVYRSQDPGDLILSRRFMVFDDRVKIRSSIGLSSGVLESFQNQQIDFTVNYSGIEGSNPMEEFKVIIRQNQRWDNVLRLKPSLIRENFKELVYQHFNFENNFRAGNEFRFFDLRSLRSSGRNVAEIVHSHDSITAYLRTDYPRTALAYTRYEDVNGQYFVNNLDVGGFVGDTQADYINTNFFLELPEPLKDKIYILGELTNWQKTEENLMRYDTANNIYTSQLLLKQGWYEYLYILESDELPWFHIEGSHFDTENRYEIFVYHRPVNGRGDRLVGYLNLDYRREE